MRLYRAVSAAECEQVLSTGTLEIIPGSLEGKWFAESLVHARAWGQMLAGLSGKPHDKIVVASVADPVAARLFRVPLLDGVGPARFAGVSDLPAFSIDEVTS
jgi:hypothetical protein